MNSLEISKDVYFDCDRKQLSYLDECQEYSENKKVNRYAIVRQDNGNLLGIHSDLKDRLKTYSRKINVPMSKIIRTLIISYLDEKEQQLREEGK